MKHAAACLLLLSVLPCAFASGDRSRDDIKRGVAEAVERYVHEVACPGVKVGPHDVMALKGAAGEMERYAVLWSGDADCDGEEGTHIAIASDDGGTFVVDPHMSSPVAEFDGAARFVRRVIDYSAGSLTLEGKAFGPYDMDSPTIPVRFTLRMDEKGNWKLADKIMLPFAL
ncbi:MAG: hypothetical protein V4633_03815 [Pseudomonadota bacterium]